MDRSQQWETPPPGPVNALLWRNPRLIKISLLPSVSVLAFLFSACSRRKRSDVVEPQSTVFQLNSMCFKELLLGSQGLLKSPKRSWSAPRNGCPRRPRAAGECRRLVGLRSPLRVLAFEPTIRIGAQRRNCSSKKQGLRNQAELK